MAEWDDVVLNAVEDEGGAGDSLDILVVFEPLFEEDGA